MNTSSTPHVVWPIVCGLIQLTSCVVLAGDFEDQARDLGLDPTMVEAFHIDVSTETQVAIAMMVDGQTKAFHYTTSKLISETSSTGDIIDHLRNETLRPSGKAREYNVYVKGELSHTTQFGEDGLEISATNTAKQGKRYLKVETNSRTGKQHTALWYRPIEK